MGRRIWTGNNARDVVGAGGAINAHHEGSVESRPTERRAKLDEFTPAPEKKKTVADFFRERDEGEAAEKAARNSGEREA